MCTMKFNWIKKNKITKNIDSRSFGSIRTFESVRAERGRRQSVICERERGMREVIKSEDETLNSEQQNGCWYTISECKEEEAREKRRKKTDETTKRERE